MHAKDFKIPQKPSQIQIRILIDVKDLKLQTKTPFEKKAMEAPLL